MLKGRQIFDCLLEAADGGVGIAKAQFTPAGVVEKVGAAESGGGKGDGGVDFGDGFVAAGLADVVKAEIAADDREQVRVAEGLGAGTGIEQIGEGEVGFVFSQARDGAAQVGFDGEFGLLALDG